jgi:hypothetical protein
LRTEWAVGHEALKGRSLATDLNSDLACDQYKDDIEDRKEEQEGGGAELWSRKRRKKGYVLFVSSKSANKMERERER